MGIVKYNEQGTFNVGQALIDGWGKDWEGEDTLIGLELKDRKKPNYTEKIKSVDWFMGIMRVHYEGGGWQCFDHAIEQFELKD